MEFNKEVTTIMEHDELKSLYNLTAADVMTTAPRTCSRFSTVLEAVMIFRDADCGAVPVMDEGKPIGIVTDRDVALALPDKPDLIARPIDEVMSTGIVSVAPEDTLAHVHQVLSSQSIRRILVVDAQGRLRGIIGWADVAPVLSDRLMGRLVTEVVEA